jgi:Bacterial Ig domain
VTIDADTGPATVVAIYRLSGAARDDIGVKSLTYTLNGGPPVPLNLTGDFYAENLTLHEGENRITVVARDAGGHTGSASRTVTYTPPDTTPPTISVTSDHPGTITAPTQVTLTADAQDNRAVQRVLFFQNGLYLDTLVKTVDTAPYRYTIDAFSLSNGVHTFTATAEDSSGLRTSARVDVIVDIERTLPEVNITSRLYILDSAYTLSGTVTDASGVAHVRLRNQSTQTDLGEISLTGNAFSVPMTVPIGLTYYMLSATDQMGNINSFDFSIQNIGPDVTPPSPVDLWASENDVRYAGHIALAAQASDDRQLGRLELLWDGTVFEKWDVPSNAVCTSDPGGVRTCPVPTGSQFEQHTFFPSLTSADNGLHTFTVRATDVAGNVKDSAAQTLNINIGAANPARPITDVPSGRIYRWPGYRNVLWHFYAPVTYSVVSIGSAPVDVLGNFSFPLPAATSLTPVLSNFNFGPECTLLPTISDPAARFAQAHLDAEYPGNLGHVILVGRSPDGLIRSGAYFYADREVKLSGTADCVRDGFHTIFHYDLPLQAGWNLIVSDVMVNGGAGKPYETRVSLGTLDGLYWSY